MQRCLVTQPCCCIGCAGLRLCGVTLFGCAEVQVMSASCRTDVCLHCGSLFRNLLAASVYTHTMQHCCKACTARAAEGKLAWLVSSVLAWGRPPVGCALGRVLGLLILMWVLCHVALMCRVKGLPVVQVAGRPPVACALSTAGPAGCVAGWCFLWALSWPDVLLLLLALCVKGRPSAPQAGCKVL